MWLSIVDGVWEKKKKWTTALHCLIGHEQLLTMMMIESSECSVCVCLCLWIWWSSLVGEWRNWEHQWGTQHPSTRRHHVKKKNAFQSKRVFMDIYKVIFIVIQIRMNWKSFAAPYIISDVFPVAVVLSNSRQMMLFELLDFYECFCGSFGFCRLWFLCL